MMGTTADSSFYVTGGTLRPDAPSYVPCQADRDLYEGLSRGQYCYVLTARQMGKSSLMARAAARLRQEGVVVLSLDLTALGQNLSPEQWYDGLRSLVAWQLDLEEELDAFWLAHERLGPLQRWMAALREVVLKRLPGRVVIAIDEIDVVQSLPFSTDEFFAAIRECYNRRSTDPEFSRLTFCLLGVASPSDLIQDTRTTPFNIGRRIELTDFSPKDAAPLVQGLGGEDARRAALLERVLYWTGGHPYLTQRLCQAVADGPGETTPADVDRLRESLFLSAGAQEQDDNLLFVRDRMLRGETDPAGLLDLYAQVRRGKRVPNDETDPRVSLLRIAGITHVEGGALRVRNRIYAHVFGGRWVQAHMPGAELRRQRAAYRRGLLRAAGVSAVILAVVVGLALLALRQVQRANQLRRVAQERLYAADIRAARQDWEAGNLGAALDLLEAHRPSPGEEDLRGFEWRYLWRLCQRRDDLFTLRGHTHWVWAVRFSGDGKTLFSWSNDGSAKRWDLATRRPVATMGWRKAGLGMSGNFSDARDRKILAWRGRDGNIQHLDLLSGRRLAALKLPWASFNDFELSPDGRLLVASLPDRTVRLWDVPRRQKVGSLRHHGEVKWMVFGPEGKKLAVANPNTVVVWDLASGRGEAVLRVPAAGGGGHCRFSPGGRFLAAAGAWGAIHLWDLKTRTLVAALRGQNGEIRDMAISPDGRTLATAGEDLTIRLWDLSAKSQRAVLRGHTAGVTSLAFAPDGKSLASGSNDRTVRVWRVAAQPEAQALHGHTASIYAVAFSPDGKLLATGSFDNTAKVWDLTAGHVVATFPGRPGGLHNVTFSPDGKLLAVGTWFPNQPNHPGEVGLWDVRARREIATIGGYQDGVGRVAFSPDGRTLATSGTAGTVKLRDLASGQEVTLPGHEGLVSFVRFSPDGRTLASAGWDATVRLWDVASHQARGILRGHSNRVHCVAFSPDGKTLASASWDHTVKLRDVAQQRKVAALRGNLAFCFVLFSPDGKTLATGSIAGPIQLWNVATRQELIALKRPGWYAPIAFSLDGQYLASGSGSDDRSVLLWRAASFAETDAPGATPQRQPAD
jgi:WD40 repeat protein